MFRNKTKNIIAIITILLGVVIIVILLSQSPDINKEGVGISTPQKEQSNQKTSPIPSLTTLGEKELSSYVLTKADQIIPPLPTITDKRKTKLFKLQEDINGFTPSEIIISRADRIRIQFTALDGNYDLAFAPPIGAYVAAAQGGSTYLGFDAIYMTPGMYTFVCQKLCPPQYAQGTLVIK